MSDFSLSESGVPSLFTLTPVPLIMLYIMMLPSTSPSFLDAVAGSRLMPAGSRPNRSTIIIHILKLLSPRMMRPAGTDYCAHYTAPLMTDR